MQDEQRPSAKATRLIESLTPETTGFVSVVALIEFVGISSNSAMKI
jgi:predicted nucleic-acid-binding protein